MLILAPLVFGLVLHETDWPLLVAAAAMGATMIAFEFSGALQLGLDQPGRFSVLELVRGWGSLLAVGLLLIGPLRTDAGFVVGMALGYAAAAVMGLGWTRRSGFSLAPRLDTSFSRTALGFGLRGQVGNVFQFLGVRLDLLLVPALLDLRTAGIYYVAVRVSDVVGQVGDRRGLARLSPRRGPRRPALDGSHRARDADDPVAGGRGGDRPRAGRRARPARLLRRRRTSAGRSCCRSC